MKTCRLIIIFYKTFFFLSFTLSLCCAILLHINGLTAFAFLFWFKVITLVLTFYFIRQYKEHEFYYYQNLGISKYVLWAATLTADMLLYITLQALTYKLA
ncbi:MAG TPA: hypothetical protein VN698_03130 [Bacteroidia bacterium]|nr:hypothetical protein [Bacteroidia bacterium]